MRYSNCFKPIFLQLNLHRDVNDHENILRFYGVTKMDTGKYLKYN